MLVEKAFTATLAGAEQVAAAARERGVFCMEAMWTRFLRALVRVRELVAAGEIGDLLLVQADLGAFRRLRPRQPALRPPPRRRGGPRPGGLRRLGRPALPRRSRSGHRDRHDVPQRRRPQRRPPPRLRRRPRGLAPGHPGRRVTGPGGGGGHRRLDRAGAALPPSRPDRRPAQRRAARDRDVHRPWARLLPRGGRGRPLSRGRPHRVRRDAAARHAGGAGRAPAGARPARRDVAEDDAFRVDRPAGCGQAVRPTRLTAPPSSARPDATVVGRPQPPVVVGPADEPRLRPVDERGGDARRRAIRRGARDARSSPGRAGRRYAVAATRRRQVDAPAGAAPRPPTPSAS